MAADPSLTVLDVSGRYRVSPDKVRLWILSGELPAVNTATVLCGKPRWMVPPDALVEFERHRASGQPPKPHPRRRRQYQVDYYADSGEQEQQAPGTAA